MGIIRMDMSKESNFFDGESGNYDAIVDEVKIVTAKESNSGNPYMIWNLTIDSGTNKGQKIMARTTAIPGKRWLLKQGLSACGVESKEHIYEFDINELMHKLVGIHIKVYEDEYTDNMGQKKKVLKREVDKFFELPNQNNQEQSFGSLDPKEEIPF